MPIDELKEAVISRTKSEPFIHLVVLAVLGCVVWLIYTGKTEHINTVLLVGSVSILMIIVTSIGMWIASRVDRGIELIYSHIQHMDARLDSADDCLVSLRDISNGIFKEVGGISSGVAIILKRERLKELTEAAKETTVVSPTISPSGTT